MPKLEVFFDFACPFCLKGHQYLAELLPDYPQIEVVWRPCEAHPRPERYGMHTDLCMQGMLFAAEHGVDLWAYCERMYDLIFNRRVNVEDIDVLAEHVGDLLYKEAFREALKNGTYREVQQQGNDYAYEKCGVWAVPAYRMNGRKLDSVENVGVTKRQLKAFLDTAE